jgi:hypothetical protein
VPKTIRKLKSVKRVAVEAELDRSEYAKDDPDADVPMNQPMAPCWLFRKQLANPDHFL